METALWKTGRKKCTRKRVQHVQKPQHRKDPGIQEEVRSLEWLDIMNEKDFRKKWCFKNR